MQFPDDFQKRAKAVCPQESKNLNTLPSFNEALETGELAAIGLVLRDAQHKLIPPPAEEILDCIKREELDEIQDRLEKHVQLNQLLKEYYQMVAGQPIFIGSVTLSPTGNCRASFFTFKNPRGHGAMFQVLCFKIQVIYQRRGI